MMTMATACCSGRRVASLLFSVLCMSLLLYMPVVASSSEAPWQASVGKNVVDEEMYGDRPSDFAPGGRLYFLERMVTAASSMEDASSNLVVAIYCKEGIVIVTTSTLSPHLDILDANDKEKNDEEPTTRLLWLTTEDLHRPPLARLSPNAWMVTGGNAVDSSILRDKICRISESLQRSNDGGQPLPCTPVSCASLARRVADHLQRPTQTIGKAGRILASYALIAGRDEKNLCCLWRIDPTGQFWKCDASAIGKGSRQAEAYLLEMVADSKVDVSQYFSSLTSCQALVVACECIQKVLPKQDTSYWQALVLKTASDGEKATSQVLSGDEIQDLINNAES